MESSQSHIVNGKVDGLIDLPAHPGQKNRALREIFSYDAKNTVC